MALKPSSEAPWTWTVYLGQSQVAECERLNRKRHAEAVENLSKARWWRWPHSILWLPTATISACWAALAAAGGLLGADSVLGSVASSVMNAAAAVAVKKPSGDAWVFDRRAGADITPLYSVVFARWVAYGAGPVAALVAWR